MGKKSKYNLVWMDCEMTGLDVKKEVIIEIATLITDSELNVLEEGPCIAIHQRDEILEQMDGRLDAAAFRAALAQASSRSLCLPQAC